MPRCRAPTAGPRLGLVGARLEAGPFANRNLSGGWRPQRTNRALTIDFRQEHLAALHLDGQGAGVKMTVVLNEPA